MTKQSFLLVSLKEDKAKELAQVISNDSCRKILDYLSDKEHATESELAKKLSLPISTIHYNLKHLMKSGIMTVDEFHYSEKGKEVNHYKLANKYIIIAPKSTHGIKEKLRSILPLALLSLAGAATIQIYNRFFKTPIFSAMKGAPAVMEGARDSALPVMQGAAEKSTQAVIEAAPEVVSQVTSTTPNYALWFFLGCIFVIILFIIFELIKSKREK